MKSLNNGYIREYVAEEKEIVIALRKDIFAELYYDQLIGSDNSGNSGANDDFYYHVCN